MPFEIEIGVSDSTAPENGVIEFIGGWSTYTTSNGDFGYDPEYEVYAAFVDYGDPGTIDPLADAQVDWADSSATIANPGMSSEGIQDTIRVEVLDTGDNVIVEVWVVVKKETLAGATGNVQSRLVSAKTASGASINTGNPTVSRTTRWTPWQAASS